MRPFFRPELDNRQRSDVSAVNLAKVLALGTTHGNQVPVGIPVRSEHTAVKSDYDDVNLLAVQFARTVLLVTGVVGLAFCLVHDARPAHRTYALILSSVGVLVHAQFYNRLMTVRLQATETAYSVASEVVTDGMRSVAYPISLACMAYAALLLRGPFGGQDDEYGFLWKWGYATWLAYGPLLLSAGTFVSMVGYRAIDNGRLYYAREGNQAACGAALSVIAGILVIVLSASVTWTVVIAIATPERREKARTEAEFSFGCRLASIWIVYTFLTLATLFFGLLHMCFDVSKAIRNIPYVYSCFARSLLAIFMSTTDESDRGSAKATMRLLERVPQESVEETPLVVLHTASKEASTVDSRRRQGQILDSLLATIDVFCGVYSVAGIVTMTITEL